jgi:DNA polymerase-1
VVLVDGSGYIFRAYHALPPLIRKRDGLPTGAVYGFCNMLQKLLAEIEAAGGAGHMAVLFDAGRDTFRSGIYSAYKAHRPPPPEDLVPQFALIREATRKFNLPSIERDGFEADDLIASYTRIAREAGEDVVIVSSDKDLMQLVGEGVRMHDPLKDRPIGEAEVREKFGVGPEKLIDLQALTGDPTDNVPGVPGVGIKTAAELLNTWGDLDSLLAHAEEIKQPKRRQNLMENADLARTSRELVRLRDDMPLDGGIEAIIVREPDPAVLFPFLEDMEFGNLLNRLRGRWGNLEAPSAAAPTSAPLQVEQYAVVREVAELRHRADAARAVGVVALHIETSSEDDMRADIWGIGLADAPGRAWYVPVGSGGGQELLAIGAEKESEAVLPLDAVLDAMRALLEDPGVCKVGHDVKRAMKLLARHGIDLGPVDDTMLLSFVLGAGRDGHDLAGASERGGGFPAPSRKNLLGTGKSAVPFAEAPVEAALALTAGSADAALRARTGLLRGLFAEHLVAVYETIERPLVPVLAGMERAGIKVDPSALSTLSDNFARRMADAEAEAHRLAGREFNVASPKQLGEVLFDEMGLAGGRKTRTKAWSTDADMLEGLAADGHPLPRAILDWRLVAKLKSTYTDTLGSQVNPDTGRVHTTYGMAGAATGRLVSVNPNLQNIPVRTEEGRRIRRAFVAERGQVLVSADYSQIELRLLAHIAGIDTLSEAFRDGADIHALTASQVFGVPVEGMNPATRRRAKAINFGIIYGISPFGLSRQLGIPQSEAKGYIDSYFERYPGIRGYMERAVAYARKHGYIVTWFGRRVYVSGINDKNHAHRSFSERAAINAPLQGSAADIIKRAMVRMDRALQRTRLNARMLLSVHDELLFEVSEGEVDALRALAKTEMETAAHLDIPLTVETGAGPNWDEAH